MPARSKPQPEPPAGIVVPFNPSIVESSIERKAPKKDQSNLYCKTFWYTDPATGERKKKFIRCTTKRGLKEKCREFTRAIENGESGERSTETVGSWLETYYQASEAHLSPYTARTYRSIINKLEPIHKIPLKNLRNHQLQKFVDDSAAGKYGEPKTRQSLHQYITLLSAAYNYAIRNRILVFNPCKGLRMPRLEGEGRQAYTPKELKTMLKAAIGTQWDAIVHLPAFAGLRRGEVLAISDEDITYGAKPTITINKELVFGDDNKLSLRVPKTDKGKRVLPLAPESLAAINRQIAWNAENKLRMGNAYKADANEMEYAGVKYHLINLTADGKPVHPNVLSHQFADFLKKAGIPNKTFHALRHTFLTIAQKKVKTATKTMQDMAGHTNPAMTGRYTHTDLDEMIEAIEGYSRYINGVEADDHADDEK